MTVHSRRDAGWVRHATGTLTADRGVAGQEYLRAWPPAGATAVDLDGIYDRLAERGYEYGPVFRGLRAVWRRAEEVYAEVALPDGESVEAFGLHPALFDAALQATGLESSAGSDEVELPFAFTGVSLFATGATALRVRVTPDGDGVGLLLADTEGVPVAVVGSLVSRPVPAKSLREMGGAPDPGLLRLDWTPLTPADPAPVDGLALIGDRPLPGGLDADAVVYPDIAALVAAGTAVPGTVAVPLTGRTDTDPVSAAHAATAEVLELVQEWLAAEELADARLLFLTHGAVAALPGDQITDLAAAAALGLLRSARTEHPGRFGHIDIDATPTTLTRTAAEAAEAGVALRNATPHTARLVQQPAVEGGIVWDTGGTVLVTGGTGVLGGAVARHLAAEHGVRDLLLVSRSGADADGADGLRAELEALGATVRIASCDVRDREALAALLAGVPALTGVVHAAGALDDGVVASLDAGRIAGVFGPKADAAWHLHELTRDLDLSAFVLFSSAVGVLGDGGQGNYAAASAFLDALASHRRSRDLAGLSLAWGLWEERSALTSGLTDTDVRRMRRAGTIPISRERGLELFDAGCAADAPALVAMPLDWAAVREQVAEGSAAPLLRASVRVPATGARRAVTAVADDDLVEALLKLPAERRIAEMVAMVREHVAAVLGYEDPELVDPNRAVRGARVRLAHRRGTAQPAQPGHRPSAARDARLRLTPRSAGWRSSCCPCWPVGRPSGRSRRPGTRRLTPATTRSPSSAWAAGSRAAWPVPEELWDAGRGGRRRGRRSSRPTAAGTWPGCSIRTRTARGRRTRREGGFLHDAAEFDAGFFGISPREALAMDPQQRLLLEASWEALERGRDRPDRRCAGSPTGVFAGRHRPSTTRAAGDGPGRDSRATSAPAAAGSVVSGRVAYTFGLEGPAVTVDTACSSSLVALHLAAQALRTGECALALAGGVTVMATPATFVEFSRQRGLVAGRPVQGVRRGARTAPAGPRASACCCWSGCRTRGATGTGCWRWCGVRRSTRTARRTA